MKKSDREIVYNKYGGCCAYCGNPLQKGWHVDHLEPIRRGVLVEGKPMTMINPRLISMENYMPSCPSCNINKHDMTIEQFREFIHGFIKSLNRDSTQYKIAKRYGLIKEVDKKILFFFETFPKF